MAKNEIKKFLTKEYIFETLKNNAIWIVGCSLYAIAVNSFVVPNNIAQSGVTGLAVFFNNLCHVPVGVTNFVLNVPLLILMWLFLGRKLVARTLWVTALLSIALDVFSFMPVYKGEGILASLFCGLLQGAGLGIIMITGATSGGTDIVARLVHKKFPHITVGSVVMVADAAIVAANMLLLRSINSGLYAIIMIFVSTRVINSLIYGTGNGKMLMIVTEKPDEVSKAIVSSSRRGVSVVPAKGAYTGKDKGILICVARKSEVSGIIKIIKSADDKTFIIVSEANEILGEGFKHSI